MEKQTITSDFLANHPVFRLEEFSAFKALNQSTNLQTRRAHLAHYVKTGRLIRVRRGVYASVPPGHRGPSFQVDPYQVASKLAPDAVLAFHTSLQFQGYAQTLWSTYTILAKGIQANFKFQDVRYRTVTLPEKSVQSTASDDQVLQRDHGGLQVRYTSLERTLVDCLDRPKWGSKEFEELWKSYESVPYLNVQKVVAYAVALGSKVTAAKTGFFLEQNQARWKVDPAELKPLDACLPARLAYWQKSAVGKCEVVPRWHLLVPTNILQRHWEEPR
jgi:predicted transcriptional regulator of viral defense system